MHFRFVLNFLIVILIFSSCDKSDSFHIPNLREINLTKFVFKIIDHKKSVKIDLFFQTKYKWKTFNGVVLVAEKGRVIYKNAFGFGNFRKKDSLQINSVFQLASISKPLTSYAIMLLAERGKISYEEDIQKYFPELPYKNITIRMLLTHRSGLPEYMYFADQYWPSRRIPIKNSDVIELMIKHKPERYYLPGKRYNYSNTNYCLLVSIIEKVSGKSFNQFMKSEVFKPLEMTNSHVLGYEEIKSNNINDFVIGYDKRGRRAEHSYLNGVLGDKGVFSTVEDLYKWDKAMYAGELVSLTTLEEAFKPAHKDLRDYDNYGFGWRINVNGGDKIVFHSGWWKGFRTYMVRKLNSHKTIIVLTNSARHNFISTRKLISLISY